MGVQACMLETVRLFGRQRLRECGEEEAGATGARGALPGGGGKRLPGRQR